MFPWLQPGNLSKNSGIACLADRKIRDYKINEFLMISSVPQDKEKEKRLWNQDPCHKALLERDFYWINRQSVKPS